MAQIVDLVQYRSSEVVEVLKDLLALAEQGRLTGLLFVCKLGANDNRAGRAGDYKRYPEQALPVVYVLKDYISGKAQQRVASDSVM